MATVMIFLLGTTMVGLSMMSLTVQTDRHADRGQSKIQATLLAESGMYALYDRIREQMWANGSYPFRVDSTELRTDTRLGQRAMGTYSARVLSASDQLADVNLNGRNLRHTTWTFEIESIGVSNGIESRIRGRFTATVDQGLRSITTVIHTGPAVGQIYYPAAAITSNGQVRMTTNQGIRTFSPDGRSGHVIGNGGLTWQPQSGSKANFQNPNILEIQGGMMTTQASLATTVSANGIGNSNGTVNYRTPGFNNVPGLPNTAANTVMPMGSPLRFANETETQAWIDNWRQTTSRPNATRFTQPNLNATQVPQRPGDQWRVIETPAVIDGNLTIPAGTQLRLMPSSSNPTENIVYVRGNVQNMGQLLNLGVTVVVEGRYNDGPSGQYTLDTQGSPYATRKALLQNSAFVSINRELDAIQFNSDASVTTGAVYAARGGIQVRGNLEIRGLLAAFRDVDIAPRNGNSFVVHYEPDAAGAGDFDPERLRQINTELVPDGIVNAFSPAPITNWVQIK